jgi:hypothetical protein
MKAIGILFFALLLTLGCHTDSPLAPDKSQVVVRGYLYAGEAVQDIRLTGTLPLGSDDTAAPPINSAQISLLKAGKTYDLVASAGDSGYYHYPDTDLTVEPGDDFQIRVSYENQVITATTTVPPAPQDVVISKSTLQLPDFDDMFQMREKGISMDSIRALTSLAVSWQNETDALYYVVVKNLENNPVSSDSRFRGGPRMYISQPRPGGEYDVNATMATHYGKHEVRVYRVNQEYADLYQSRNQDSRDLNEPLTNIQNGLGVFSAFSSKSVYFTLLQ